jgi:hypothetical protein
MVPLAKLQFSGNDYNNWRPWICRMRGSLGSMSTVGGKNFSSADTLASAENFMHTAGIARCCWSGRGIRNGVQIVRTVWFSTGPAGTPFREQ